MLALSAELVVSRGRPVPLDRQPRTAAQRCPLVALERHRRAGKGRPSSPHRSHAAAGHPPPAPRSAGANAAAAHFPCRTPRGRCRTSPPGEMRSRSRNMGELLREAPKWLRDYREEVGAPDLESAVSVSAGWSVFAMRAGTVYNTYRVYPHSRIVTPLFSVLLELLPTK